MKALADFLQQKSRWASVLCISAVFSSTTMAASTTLESPRSFGIHGQEVTDRVLASMRGRFVEGRKVAFFGVQMRTDWLRQDGHYLNMQMNVDIDLTAGRHRPVINIYHSRDLGKSVSNATLPELYRVSDNGALSSVSGVVQNIQVAGDGNGVHNNVNWVVSEQSAIPTSPPNNLTPALSSGHYIDTSGRHTQVMLDQQGLGYQIDIPGVGRVTQQMSGQNLKGAALLQSSQLNSNQNQVLNHIGLQVDLTPARRGMSQLRTLQRSVEQLRGL